ncbi:MAG: hypothetical protein AAF713_16220 [Pseudomonadota bacterium]
MTGPVNRAPARRKTKTLGLLALTAATLALAPAPGSAQSLFLPAGPLPADAVPAQSLPGEAATEKVAQSRFPFGQAAGSPTGTDDPASAQAATRNRYPVGQAAGSPNGGGISKAPLAPAFGEIPAEAVVVGGAVIVGGVVIALLLGDDTSTVSTVGPASGSASSP